MKLKNLLTLALLIGFPVALAGTACAAHSAPARCYGLRSGWYGDYANSDGLHHSGDGWDNWQDGDPNEPADPYQVSSDWLLRPGQAKAFPGPAAGRGWPWSLKRPWARH